MFWVRSGSSNYGNLLAQEGSTLLNHIHKDDGQ